MVYDKAQYDPGTPGLIFAGTNAGKLAYASRPVSQSCLATLKIIKNKINLEPHVGCLPCRVPK